MVFERENLLLEGGWRDLKLLRQVGVASRMIFLEKLCCVVERDTVVSVDVMTVGRGGSSVKVLKQYRVVGIHGKYCSKWFISKVPQTLFGKDSKSKSSAN